MVGWDFCTRSSLDNLGSQLANTILVACINPQFTQPIEKLLFGDFIAQNNTFARIPWYLESTCEIHSAGLSRSFCRAQVSKVKNTKISAQYHCKVVPEIVWDCSDTISCRLSRFAQGDQSEF